MQSSYKLLIVGGGAGGCAISAMFARILGKNAVAVIEPKAHHYYQPLWTLVGGGLKEFAQSMKDERKLLHDAVHLIQDEAVSIDANENLVKTSGGKKIAYDWLVVACGLTLQFEKIRGLPESFETSAVCSNYHPTYVLKTREALANFKAGNAIFTFPSTTIKCPGAPQKIMYIAEEQLRKTGRRDKAQVLYNTSLGVIFGVPKYAAALTQVCQQRNIRVNLRHELIEVKPQKREAIFNVKDADGVVVDTKSFKYEMLHVAPPCGPPALFAQSPGLPDKTGFLDVDKFTMQHARFRNIFGIGDCTNAPTSKSAAAVAEQCGVLKRNLQIAMAKSNSSQNAYNGYASCPLVTGSRSCILAEFNGYTGEPMETFPFNQAKERLSMFILKAHLMPFLYWNIFLRGWWTGPGMFRRIFHLGRSASAK